MPNLNCPRNHVATKQSTWDARGHEIKTGRLNARLTKNAHDPRKNFELKLGPIHAQLRIAVNEIRRAQLRENIAVADITFIVSAGDLAANTHARKSITFPIKIPSKRFYHYSDACRDVDPANENTTLRLLSRLFHRGKQMIPVRTCGHTPKFDNSRGDPQYVMHSEQALYAYLNTRAGCEMLVSRLISEMRASQMAEHGATVKVYAAILHIHSHKTICGPCETELLGMMGSRNQPIGSPRFLDLLRDELQSRSVVPGPGGEPPSSVSFTYPGRNKPHAAPAKRGVPLFCTYTADTIDADHKTIQQGTIQQLDLNQPGNARRVFVANFNQFITTRYLQAYEPDLTQRTTFSSASDKSRTIAQSRMRVDRVSLEEDQAVEGIARLFI